MFNEFHPGSKLPQIIFTVVFILVAGYGVNKLYTQSVTGLQKSPPSTSQQTDQPTDQTPTDSQNPNYSKPGATPLPSSFSTPVPFTAQAPTGIWDELHDTACEEAVSIIVKSYYDGLVTLDPTYVDDQINILTQWEDDNYGYHLDITTKETTKMIENVYHLNTEIVDISEETIKQALVDGKLVIIPTNGQLLNNPYYKSPGPIYHMIVVTGYDSKGFIVNDPGTKRGEGYKYSYDTLYNSNGGWSHSQEQVDLSDKKIIIVSQY